MRRHLAPMIRQKQARKLQATLVRNYHWLTYLPTGVKCRATSVAKNCHVDSFKISPSQYILFQTEKIFLQICEVIFAHFASTMIVPNRFMYIYWFEKSVIRVCFNLKLLSLSPEAWGRAVAINSVKLGNKKLKKLTKNKQTNKCDKACPRCRKKLGEMWEGEKYSSHSSGHSWRPGTNCSNELNP